MAKRRRKPYTPPPQGDTGPDTAAQRRGAIIINFREDNGTVYRRKRRDHALEIYLRAGKLSARQAAAGMELLERHCMTELSAESAFSRIHVDSSPDPARVALVQAQRLTAFAELSKHIPRGCRGPVEHVCIRGRVLSDGYSRDEKDESSHLAILAVALDILANVLRI